METLAPERRKRPIALVLGVIAAGVLVWAAVEATNRVDLESGPWVRLTTLERLSNEGVMYFPREKVFLSFNPLDPMRPAALSAISPHSSLRFGIEMVLFCRSSGWFEGVRWGSRFDRFGRYALGPAPRGMDHAAVKVKNGAVYVEPALVVEGEPRFTHDPLEREGSFCGGPEAEPGFASKAPPVLEDHS